MDVKGTSAAPEGGQKKERIFEGIRRTVLLSLLGLLAVCLVFAWRTRSAMEHLPFLPGAAGAAGTGSSAASVVDLHTWQTAQALRPLAVSAEEVEFAREAERLADHETDQAFASALRLAIPQKRTMSARAQALEARIAELEAAVAADQAQVKATTPAGGGGCGQRLGRLEAGGCGGTGDGRGGDSAGADGARYGRVEGCAAGPGARGGRPADGDSAGALGARGGDAEVRRGVTGRGRGCGDFGGALRDAGGADVGVAGATEPADAAGESAGRHGKECGLAVGAARCDGEAGERREGPRLPRVRRERERSD